jgi:hypothetical protein
LSILRDDRLVALHDLVAACRASASHCALAADLMAGDPKAESLQALADQRNREADFFGKGMIEADDIPEGPPEERSLLQTALAGAKAAFADDGAAALLQDCRTQEEEVLRRAEAGADAPLRESEKTAAAQLAADARARLETLLKV